MNKKQDDPTPSLKKHKSTYTFISLKSMQNTDTNPVLSSESLASIGKESGGGYDHKKT